MHQQSKRILTLLAIMLPFIIAGILQKNITLDILPIMVVAVFSFWVAIRAKRTSKEKL